MKRRELWRAVLDVEVKRWSEKSYDQLRAELAEMKNYVVEFSSKQYEVEVDLLENTEDTSTLMSVWTMEASRGQFVPSLLTHSQ